MPTDTDHHHPGEPPPPDPTPTGQHRLGPHVVGQRVVVRRVLRGETGPTGGPALTDVLGVCTAWGRGRCVVLREDGSTVEIALTDVVSGKPVPPRASVRSRVSARDAELHGTTLWPGVETTTLGEWVLRTDPTSADRLFKRANSVLAMGRPDVPFPDAESAVRSFYAERGRPALAQVELDSMTEHSFRTAGWKPLPGGETRFCVASVAALARALPRPGEEVSVTEEGPRVLAELSLDGPDGPRMVSRGRAALDGDWLGLHAIATAPAHRGRGLASSVLAELVDWGASLGATTAWLHVEGGNDPAVRFYERLGFRVHHACRYLISS